MLRVAALRGTTPKTSRSTGAVSLARPISHTGTRSILQPQHQQQQQCSGRVLFMTRRKISTGSPSLKSEGSGSSVGPSTSSSSSSPTTSAGMRSTGRWSDQIQIDSRARGRMNLHNSSTVRNESSKAVAPQPQQPSQVAAESTGEAAAEGGRVASKWEIPPEYAARMNGWGNVPSSTAPSRASGGSGAGTGTGTGSRFSQQQQAPQSAYRRAYDETQREVPYNQRNHNRQYNNNNNASNGPRSNAAASTAASGGQRRPGRYIDERSQGGQRQQQQQQHSQQPPRAAQPQQQRQLSHPPRLQQTPSTSAVSPAPVPHPPAVPRSAQENARIQLAQRAKRKKQSQKPPKDVFIPEAVSVSNLAGLLGARMPHFEATMKAMGMEITRHDHILTADESSLLALEYNTNPVIGTQVAQFDLEPKPQPEDMSIYPLRPPVVTIMGHVDHGKTTLLDSLRKTSVAAGEAGGITQHIGAFSVLLPSNQRITFLDTPGHAAFSAMRARGAQMTDIVVLVVAAEDGVMPQTAEAIKHAEEAGVPVIVAINKCDKYGAEPEKAKQALLQHGITVEDLGGETQCVEVSGLTGKNLDKLEEAILTLSEVLDLRAETTGIKGEGIVLESQIEKGRGNVATVLVKRGTLKVGDTIVAGRSWCKVKSLVNDTGKSVTSAPPGTPVKVLGWKDLPGAGDEMLGAESEEQAKEVVNNRNLKAERQAQLKALSEINAKRQATAEEEDQEKSALKEHKRQAWMFHQGMLDAYPEPIRVKKQLSVAALQAKEDESTDIKQLRMVVKGDVSGTVEAVCDALAGLPADQIKVSVIQHGVGNISESDIQFAATCGATVLGFNVKADKKLLQTARQMKVGLKSYGVIYKLLDDVKVQMAELLPKDIEIKVIGEAKIAQVFSIKVKGTSVPQLVAGCRIVNGGINRKEQVRVVRNGETVWEGSLGALKRGKDDIEDAKKGTECGMEFEGFKEFVEGDVIQSIQKTEVLRKL